MELNQKIELLRQYIKGSRKIVFFGGAGVSTESGIPDFRSVDGLYHKKYMYPPEMILSHTFFMRKTEEFYQFYKEKMIYLSAEPNITHKKLAVLEQEGKLSAVVTQNIDGLHQKAGSKAVYELHGSVHRNHCIECGKYFSIEHVLATEDIPRCDCGGIIKPDVVLYEEGLQEEVISGAVKKIVEADLLIVGGTSLAVYPAAGLLRYYGGEKLVAINKTELDCSDGDILQITGSLGDVMSEL